MLIFGSYYLTGLAIGFALGYSIRALACFVLHPAWPEEKSIFVPYEGGGGAASQIICGGSAGGSANRQDGNVTVYEWR